MRGQGSSVVSEATEIRGLRGSRFLSFPSFNFILSVEKISPTGK